MINTKLSVPAGGSVHVSAGDVSSPSQENETGIASPSAKAGLLISRLGASVAVGGTAVAVGSAAAGAHAESRSTITNKKYFFIFNPFLNF
jgi:hypothetical protein